MAKGEKAPTPLELLSEHEQQLPTWAGAVAKAAIDHAFNDPAVIELNELGFKKDKNTGEKQTLKDIAPVFYAALKNAIAVNISVGRPKGPVGTK
jgi:hypothetical protein